MEERKSGKWPDLAKAILMLTVIWSTAAFVFSVSYINAFCIDCLVYFSISDLFSHALGRLGPFVFLAVLIASFPFMTPIAMRPRKPLRLKARLRYWRRSRTLKYYIALFMVVIFIPVPILAGMRIFEILEGGPFVGGSLANEIWDIPLVFLLFIINPYLFRFVSEKKMPSPFIALTGLGALSILVIYLIGDGLARRDQMKTRSGCAEIDVVGCVNTFVVGAHWSLAVIDGDIAILPTSSIERFNYGVVEDESLKFE